MTNETPYWEAHGEYGYWVVSEYRQGDNSRATYNQLRGFPSRRLAMDVAAALNAAYGAMADADDHAPDRAREGMAETSRYYGESRDI